MVICSEANRVYFVRITFGVKAVKVVILAEKYRKNVQLRVD